jgi:hypothetical protein
MSRFHLLFVIRAKTSLGGTNRNRLKEWLRNQKQPNHFLGPLFFKNSQL